MKSLLIKKVNFKNNKVTIEYDEKFTDEDTDIATVIIKSNKLPNEEFVEHWNSFKEDIFSICEFKYPLSKVTLLGISFSYKEDNHPRGIVFTIFVNLAKTHAPMLVNLPYLDSKEFFLEDKLKDILNLIHDYLTENRIGMDVQEKLEFQ